ncbi:MAG: 50S ribosomal protein L17 [Candidatus Peregrinibacteria bacterium]
MRHRISRLRLTQKPAHAKMLLRNLVTSLLLYENIRTTRSRADVVRPVIDRIITVAKSKTPSVAIRRINRIVTDKNACRKVMEVLRDRYKARSSGMTRMVPVGSRKGDGAMLVDVSLIDAADSIMAADTSKVSSKKKA